MDLVVEEGNFLSHGQQEPHSKQVEVFSEQPGGLTDIDLRLLELSVLILK